jgi:predicted nucleotide-binding protein
MAKLGRRRVCPLYEQGVELPSDYYGIGYIPLDSNGAWKMQLARELRDSGLEVDINKAI